MALTFKSCSRSFTWLVSWGDPGVGATGIAQAKAATGTKALTLACNDAFLDMIFSEEKQQSPSFLLTQPSSLDLSDQELTGC